MSGASVRTLGEIETALKQEPPAGAVQQREGQHGKTLDYMSIGWVKQALQDAAGFSYSARAEVVRFEVDLVEGKRDGRMISAWRGWAVVKATIMLGPPGAPLCVREDLGAAVHDRQANLEGAVQAVKSAASDAFKRAAFSMGRRVGLDLRLNDELWDAIRKETESLAVGFEQAPAGDQRCEVFSEAAKNEQLKKEWQEQLDAPAREISRVDNDAAKLEGLGWAPAMARRLAEFGDDEVVPKDLAAGLWTLAKDAVGGPKARLAMGASMNNGAESRNGKIVHCGRSIRAFAFAIDFNHKPAVG